MRLQITIAMALASLAGAARAEHAVLVRRDPPPAAAPKVATAPKGAAAQVKFKAVMDSVFGAGKWRETGGYRTPERENQLRAEGALTVRAGAISRHSLGRPGAPGAYDAVVTGVSLDVAAARLRTSGAPFRKILAEGTHGTQGAHLHLEPFSIDFSGIPSIAAAGPAWTVSDVTPAQQALARLRAAASGGDGMSQLRLGAAYAEGRMAPRDLVAAYVWTAMAGANPASDESVKRDSEKVLALIAPHMDPEDIARARRFVRPQVCGAAEPEAAAPVVLIGAPAACAGALAIGPASPAG